MDRLHMGSDGVIPAPSGNPGLLHHRVTETSEKTFDADSHGWNSVIASERVAIPSCHSSHTCPRPERGKRESMSSSPRRHRGHEEGQPHSRRAAKNAAVFPRFVIPASSGNPGLLHHRVTETSEKTFGADSHGWDSVIANERAAIPLLSFQPHLPSIRSGGKRESIKPRITGHTPPLRFPESEMCKCVPRLFRPPSSSCGAQRRETAGGRP